MTESQKQGKLYGTYVDDEFNEWQWTCSNKWDGSDDYEWKQKTDKPP